MLTDSAMTVSTRPHLLGFYVNPQNRLERRYFWRSNSEGCWRAGTGYAGKSYETLGRFLKGREEDYAGGYIFETQLHYQLEAILSVAFS